jgi:glutamine amidotransferase
MKVSVVKGLTGNFNSVCYALTRAGANPALAHTPEELTTGTPVVLPGVGSFASAMDYLNRSGLSARLRELAESSTPILGICLGAQLLFESGDEDGVHRGLGLLRGRTQSLRDLSPLSRLPHTGWNQVTFTREVAHESKFSSEFDGYYFFNHGYFFSPEQDSCVRATTEYGAVFPVVVEQGDIIGMQFHPERSQDLGLKCLKTFLLSSSSAKRR